MTDALANLSQAVALLAQAKTLDEVRHIRNVASAAEHYARAERLGDDAVTHATHLKLRAARKAGELLIQMANDGERELGRPPKESSVATLSDLGVSREESSRWQAVARVPEEKFERAVESGRSETAIAALSRPREVHVVDPAYTPTCAHCEIHCPSGRYKSGG